MLLGNEIMTALQADMLLREKPAPSNSSRMFKIVNLKESWVNDQAPIIQLDSKHV
jgi:hypothetical protein